MKKLLLFIAVSLVMLTVTGCSNNRLHRFEIGAVKTDSLVTYFYDRPVQGELIDLVLKKGDVFCVYTYGKDYSNYVAKQSLEKNMFVIDGKVVGYNTSILYEAGEKDIRLISKGDLRTVKKDPSVSRKEYRALMSRVAPLKIQARWHLLWCIVGLFVGVGLYALIPEDSRNVFVRSKSGIMLILAALLPYLYFQVNDADSFWFVVDARGFGWFGMLMLIVYMYMYSTMFVERLKQGKENPVNGIFLAIAAVLFAMLAYTLLVQFWDQGQHILWSIVLILLSPAAAGSALSTASGSLSSGSSSSGDDGSSIELPSGRKVSGTFAGDDFNANNGKTYKRTGWGSNDWEAKD